MRSDICHGPAAKKGKIFQPPTMYLLSKSHIKLSAGRDAEVIGLTAAAAATIAWPSAVRYDKEQAGCYAVCALPLILACLNVRCVAKVADVSPGINGEVLQKIRYGVQDKTSSFISALMVFFRPTA